MAHRLLALLVTACIPLVVAHKAYASLFPNGRSVPCSPPDAPGCAPNGTCLAVGHADCVGGGPLNDFGRALAAANYKWTAELCEADSDGDGISNGAELGDPLCVWKSGGAAPMFPAASHPGVAESAVAARAVRGRAGAPAPGF